MSRKKQTFLYMSAAEILDYHRDIISIFGGNPGWFPDTCQRVESIISQRHYASLKYRSVASHAAYLIYLLNKGHAFVDGNKRVSIVAGITFLRLNGYDLLTNDRELEAFALRVAASDPRDKEKTIFNMARWIRERLIKL